MVGFPFIIDWLGLVDMTSPSLLCKQALTNEKPDFTLTKVISNPTTLRFSLMELILRRNQLTNISSVRYDVEQYSVANLYPCHTLTVHSYACADEGRRQGR